MFSQMKRQSLAFWTSLLISILWGGYYFLTALSWTLSELLFSGTLRFKTINEAYIDLLIPPLLTILTVGIYRKNRYLLAISTIAFPLSTYLMISQQKITNRTSLFNLAIMGISIGAALIFARELKRNWRK